MPDVAHVFTGIDLSALPEIDYDVLVELSDAARGEGVEESVLAPLVDAIRKVGWAKTAGLEANWASAAVTEELSQAPAGYVPMEIVGQVRHSKAVVDFIVHCRAATDSEAVFLNELLKLGKSGGARDFKHAKFREMVSSEDEGFGDALSGLGEWFDRRIRRTDSLAFCRDEWIHRDSPVVGMLVPFDEGLGALPIPRAVDGPIMPAAVTHWRSEEFIEYHFGRLVTLTNAIAQRALERLSGKSKPDSRRSGRLSMLAMVAGEGVRIEGFVVGKLTQQTYFGGDSPVPEEREA